MEILLGCGNRHEKDLVVNGNKEWHDPVFVDIDPNCGADLIWDLNVTPWPFDDGVADEIHAYELLEHIGTQGDFRAYFDHMYEVYRILKPGGYFMLSVPLWNSIHAWGDPGHTRIINTTTLNFLIRSVYEQTVGKSTMTDYRWYWKGDFEARFYEEREGRMFVILQKPTGTEDGNQKTQ